MAREEGMALCPWGSLGGGNFTVQEKTASGEKGRNFRPQTEDQKKVALDTIADVDASGLWPGRATTDVEPAGDFWEAEPEHQDYLQKYPYGYNCHFPRPHWVLPKRAATTS